MKKAKGFAAKYGVGLLAVNAFLRSVGVSSGGGAGKIGVRLDAAFLRHGRPRPSGVKITDYCAQQKTFILEAAKGHYKSNANRVAQPERGEPKVTSAPPYQGDVNSAAFLESFAWRQMRMRVIRHYGPRCMCCGATPQTGATMNVDHIKPRKTHPHLALEFDNLQVLCHECNHGKGNWDTTDWRPSAQPDDEQIDPAVAEFIRGIANER
jgi:5-methylcytosine-specific restriction endonuclease McrA